MIIYDYHVHWNVWIVNVLEIQNYERCERYMYTCKIVAIVNAAVNGNLDPTLSKTSLYSPFVMKFHGQDSPTIHLHW